MSRTAWSVSVALVLIVLSVAAAITRTISSGADIDGPRSSNAWRVTLVVTGRLQPDEASLRTPLAPDFRQQHAFLEDFSSKELLARTGKGKNAAANDLVWQRASMGGVQPFRIVTTFHCFLGMRRPTNEMEKATRDLDLPAQQGTLLKATARIERDHPEIQKLARQLAEQAGSDVPRELQPRLLRLRRPPG